MADPISRRLMRPASFRGAAFHVEVGARVDGRRLAPHEYPKRDDPYPEDMGRKGRTFPITAYCIGPDYQDVRDDLISALEQEGSATLARTDDVLPVRGDTDRRGWWGDLDVSGIRNGWPIGSRLWLLDRVTITGPEARQGSTLARAEDYTRECLQPFVSAGVASRLSATAERSSIEGIRVRATLFRGPLGDIQLSYAPLWNGVRV